MNEAQCRQPVYFPLDFFIQYGDCCGQYLQTCIGTFLCWWSDWLSHLMGKPFVAS